MYSPINDDVEWGSQQQGTGSKGMRDPTFAFAEAQVTVDKIHGMSQTCTIPPFKQADGLLGQAPCLRPPCTQVRRGFVRKVLGLLSFQLAITAAAATAFVAVPEVSMLSRRLLRLVPYLP